MHQNRLGATFRKVSKTRWEKDEHHDRCDRFDCSQYFGFWHRRHHCRICGKIYCSACVPFSGYYKFRICLSCYFFVTFIQRKDNDRPRKRMLLRFTTNLIVSARNCNMTTIQRLCNRKWLPHWQENEAKVCKECQSVFTWKNRRHHCRICGMIYCSSCCYVHPSSNSLAVYLHQSGLTHAVAAEWGAQWLGGGQTIGQVPIHIRLCLVCLCYVLEENKTYNAEKESIGETEISRRGLVNLLQYQIPWFHLPYDLAVIIVQYLLPSKKWNRIKWEDPFPPNETQTTTTSFSERCHPGQWCCTRL